MAKYNAVLFDLDGTLSESAKGIRYSLEKTVAQMNKPQIDFSDYTKYVGPPLLNTFRGMCGFTEEESVKAVSIYQHYYSTKGMYQNKLYSGIDVVLKTLKENNVKLSVCSSKYELFAENICEYLNIKQYFTAVCGSAKDGSRKEKNQLIPYACEKLVAKLDKSTVLIGDTKFDAIGAKETKIDFIGANYGYGTELSMTEAGAKIFVEKPLELLNILL